MFRFIVFFILFFLTSIVSSQSEYVNLTDKQIAELGYLIWKNEGQNKVQHLTTWNRGEDFPSLGLGHFIWYPNKEKGQFKEQFPELLDYFQEHGVQLPEWLENNPLAPWKSREQFYAEFDQEKLSSLRGFLSKYMNLQVKFIISRLEKAIPLIFSDCETQQKKKLKTNLLALTSTPEGIFTLLDYINFKGEGLSKNERYQGEGWGLKQVLLAMPLKYNDPLRAFGLAADEILTRRVKNAPRNELRWLKGWRNRVHSYQNIVVN